MGTEQQQTQSGDNGGAGGNAAPGTNGEQARPGQAFGTASRAPLFSQQPGQGTETQQQEPAAPAGGATQPKPGRAPITLPDGALRERLARAERKGAEGLLKLIGARDENEAKEKLAKLNAAGEEAEKRRLAEMGEVERLKTELEAARQEVETLRQQLASYEQEREHAQQDQLVERVAGEHVSPKAMKLYRIELAQHVKKLATSNPELAEKFGERGIRRFTEKWLKENPEFAKASGAPVVEQPKPGEKPPATAAKQGSPPVVRRPVTTGAPPRRAPSPPVVKQGASPVTANGKTARPGQANSMSPAEVKAYAAANGINYQPI